MSPSKTAPRRGPAMRAATAGVSILTLSVGASACGSSSPKHPAASKTAPKPTTSTPTTTVKLDTERVALAITESIKSEKGLTATVACPSDVPQLKGHDFTCVATTFAKLHGKRVPVHTTFTVTQVNSRGNVYYSSPQ